VSGSPSESKDGSGEEGEADNTEDDG